MATSCLYTLEPMEHGGVIAKVREASALHRRFGHVARLLYTATNQVPANNRLEKLRYFLQTPPHWQAWGGLDGFAVPDWPMPLWVSYLMPVFAGWQVIQASQIHVGISGSSHVALPAALLGKKFIVWIGTLYEDELRGRAGAGDRWAQRVLDGPAWPILAWEEKFIFKRAALILTNGAHTAGVLGHTYPEVASRIRVVIYPVDTDLFRPDPNVLAEAPYPYLLFTARINDPRKNIAMLFRAFARVRARYPQLKLVLTGDPPGTFVQNALAQSGVADEVVFVGYQSREALIRLYQGASLFVLPSLQEGLGISMLEALACGLPVVSTRCGGPESVIADRVTGRLTPNADESAFAEAILELLDHPPLLCALREQAAVYARATFSKEAVGQRLFDAFHTVYPEHFAQLST